MSSYTKSGVQKTVVLKCPNCGNKESIEDFLQLTPNPADPYCNIPIYRCPKCGHEW